MLIRPKVATTAIQKKRSSSLNINVILVFFFSNVIFTLDSKLFPKTRFHVERRESKVLQVCKIKKEIRQIVLILSTLIM